MSEQIQGVPPEAVPEPETDNVPSTDPVRQYLREIGRVPLLSAGEEVDLSKRIEAGLFAKRLLNIQADREDQNQDFSEEERLLGKKYLRRAQNLQLIAFEGDGAKRKMLEANLRLVVSIAKRHNGRGLDLLDVIQEGNVGLVRAVEKFDYTRGYKFSTYATWWIRQAIFRGVADTARTIRLPIHLVEQVNKYSAIKGRLAQNLGRPATDDELSEELDLPVARVKVLGDLANSPLELDRIIGNDGDARLGDFIEDASSIPPEDMAVTGSIRDDVRSAIDKLDKRSAYIMKRRYGLDTGKTATLDEIGREVGLTRERIRQLEKKAMTTLKVLFESMGITGPEG